MAYFSNGTEGSDYEERYCNRCIHQVDCQIWLLHLIWNGDGGDRETVLDGFIPRTKDGIGNEECRMFFPIAKLKPEAVQELRKLSQQEWDCDLPLSVLREAGVTL